MPTSGTLGQFALIRLLHLAALLINELLPLLELLVVLVDCHSKLGIALYTTRSRVRLPIIYAKNFVVVRLLRRY